MTKKFISILLVVILAVSMTIISTAGTSAASTSTFLKVNATSNYFSTSSASFDEQTKQLTVTYYFKCEKDIMNVHWNMYYDPSVLVPKSTDNNTATICPEIGSNSCVCNLNASGDTSSRRSVKYVASNIGLYDFSSQKKIFAKVTFDVVATKATETTVDLCVNTMGVSKLDASGEISDGKEEEYLVDYGVVSNSTTKVEKGVTIEGKGSVIDDSFLTLTTTSNYFPTVETKYTQDTKRITVTYYFQCEKNILDVQWYMYYDPSVLSPAKDENGKNINNKKSICPEIGNTAGPINLAGSGDVEGHKSVKYSASSLSLFDFSSKKTVFATVVFDVIATEPVSTTVNLYVDTLRVSVIDEDTEITITDEEVILAKNGEFYPNTLWVDLSTEATPSTYGNVLIGDVNGDGEVSIIDATEIQKYIAELVDFTDAQKIAADTNGDGEISIIDATEIQKYIAELIDKLG